MIERYTLPEMGRVWSEQNQYAKWLQVEIAATAAWAELGEVPREAVERLAAGARFELARVEEHLRRTRHDMTAFLAAVAESLGEESRYLHLGLTANDVKDTALSLQLVESADLIERDLQALLRVLERRALEHRQTVMIGRTHGVHAEPTTFGFKLCVWIAEQRRNLERLAEARRQIAVGKFSGAVGTHANVPPAVEEIACARLGLAVAPVTTQILQRDRHAHFMAALAVIASTLEQFATEIRGLQRTEVREVEEPFGEGQTGSSSMPHKRNPELTERICGLARVVRGNALTALENVALWHERDISHSSAERIGLPDNCILVDYLLQTFTFVMEGLRIHPDQMRRNLELTQGLIFSQRVLTALVEKGLSRQTAYHLVQRNAMRAWDERRSFRQLLEADPDVRHHLGPPELDELFSLEPHLKYIDVAYERLGLLRRK